MITNDSNKKKLKIYKDLATKIRANSLRMTHGGQSGHVGSMLSMADILAVLYESILRVKPESPDWPERDRFILSKGHGGGAVYAVLAEKGFFPKEWLKTTTKTTASCQDILATMFPAWNSRPAHLVTACRWRLVWL